MPYVLRTAVIDLDTAVYDFNMKMMVHEIKKTQKKLEPKPSMEAFLNQLPVVKGLLKDANNGMIIFGDITADLGDDDPVTK